MYFYIIFYLKTFIDFLEFKIFFKILVNKKVLLYIYLDYVANVIKSIYGDFTQICIFKCLLFINIIKNKIFLNFKT